MSLFPDSEEVLNKRLNLYLNQIKINDNAAWICTLTKRQIHSLFIKNNYGVRISLLEKRENFVRILSSTLVCSSLFKMDNKYKEKNFISIKI